ncbi:MAG: 16S rRNA (uracil(1498)-N(3))-methyltransferase [Chitinophagales bacterium]|nr:16S rRNA (uracil(1498)-N(3))-methyltransferase [Chitinophagales bacterium]
MNIFYCAEAAVSNVCALDETEAHHAVSVMRLKVGDSIFIFDGKGKLFSANILSAHKKEVTIKIDAEKTEKKLPYHLHIAIAATKQMERLEWFTEKAVELGVSKITPIICARSERKELKTDRLKKAAMAACKQAKQFELPEIEEAVSLNKFLQSNLPEHKFITWCEMPETKIELSNFTHQNSVFLIGPEGDFTATEVTAAKQVGFNECSLGNSILRTETAGIFVAALKRE